MYDYILFRGSDIKDIRVVNNVPAMPNDPAIMQMQLPTQHIAQQPFQPPQFAPPMGSGASHMGNAMGPAGPFGGPYGAMGAISGLTATGLAPGSLAANTGNAASGLSKVQQQKQASELNTAILQPSSTTVDYKDQGGNGNISFKEDRISRDFTFIIFFTSSNSNAYKLFLLRNICINHLILIVVFKFILIMFLVEN